MSILSHSLRKPVLLVLAITICLGMIRLGFWQLDRAAQKQVILDHFQQQTDIAPVNVAKLVPDLLGGEHADLRFRKVMAKGRYLSEKTILIDNQVWESQVGYLVITPFKLDSGAKVLLVNRGWVPVGDDRRRLPVTNASEQLLEIQGRLNHAPAKPPLWDDSYPVSDGPVWQFLPVAEFAAQMNLIVLPLVLELAPEQTGAGGYARHWQRPDDKWVARHKAYALQWFSMALVFLIACVIVALRSARQS